MVELVDGASGRNRGRGWRGSLLVAVVGLTAVANACGGRTVWVDEPIGDAGESGNAGKGGVGGYGGDYGGAYGGGGDYGGGAYGGAAYGGYAGTSYGGAYGGSYGGAYGGTPATGGAYIGGTAGTGYGGTGYGGTGKGGYGGTGKAGSAGMAGKGGCGASSGTGGSGGSPALGKACAVFCPRFPYQSCTSDFEGPRDCLSKCQNGFNLGAWCQVELVNFLGCASQYLDPNAECSNVDGQCYGPGCTIDAVNNCAFEYIALLDCQDSPRPLPPCPPPPNPPLPPNCGQGESIGPDYCSRETQCPGALYTTECYYEYDASNPWYCDCYANGSYLQSVRPGNASDPCQAGAALCGLY